VLWSGHPVLCRYQRSVSFIVYVVQWHSGGALESELQLVGRVFSSNWGKSL